MSRSVLTVTIDDILSWGPCDPWPERIPDLARSCSPRRRRWTALQIIECGSQHNVPAEDLLWIVLRPELIAEPDLHELACRFASRALRQERKAGREPDPRSWRAIRAKRRWLRGAATDEELAAAGAAARAVAWAAGYGARAARDAARAAVWATVWAAVWGAEWRWQLACTVRLLRARGYQ